MWFIGNIALTLVVVVPDRRWGLRRPAALRMRRTEERLRRKGPLVTTQEVGLEVLAQLRRLDDVAYLRFASVYKDFQELTDFERELGILLQKREPRGAAGAVSGRRTRSRNRA